jgi:hypothetical protein
VPNNKSKARLGISCLIFIKLVGAAPVVAQDSAVRPQARSQEELRAEAEENERALNVFLREQAVLFRQGELELELTTFYSSNNEANLRIDNTVIPNLETRSVDSALIARYGLIDNLLLSLELPFLVYAEREFVVVSGRTSAVSRDDDLGIGDVGMELSYQLTREQGAWPAMALNLDVKSDTGNELLGTGSWNVGGLITLVKTIDPVVFFGGLGYTKTLEQDGFNPGDQILYKFGTGFSLNDRVSFNAQVVGAAAGRDKLEGRTLSGSGLDVIGLQFGATALVGNNLFIEPVVSAGLTDDAEDAVVGINLLYRFEQLYPLPFLAREDAQ